ncbi:lipopolysaccharide biosynthesis protein [Crateriforma spongiae]|uniref:lipopolysaccharide biosynthesis protein n=1 Tax=Crateriforma spongiae TaxID=2724528 RepID=UPI001447CE44|nr:hypothetical protein [Crateriforma spongiae]
MNGSAHGVFSRLLRRPGLSAALVKAFGVAASFAFTIQLAVLFGLQKAGEVQYAIAVVTMGAAVAKLGLDHAVFRLGADTDGEKAFCGLFAGLLQILVFSLAVTICFMVLVFLLVTSNRQLIWVVAAAAICPLATMWVVAEFGKGRGALLFWSIFHNSFLYAAVCLTLVCGGRLEVFTEVWAVCVFSIWAWIVALSSVLVVVKWATRIGVSVSLAEVRGMNGTVWRQSLNLFPVSFSSSAQNWLDSAILGTFGSSEAVSVMRIANRMAMVVGFVNSISLAAITPKIVAAIRDLRYGEMCRQWRLSAIFPFALGLACVLFISCLAKFGLMPRVVVENQQVWLVFGILVSGQLLSLAPGAVGYVLLACHDDIVLKRASIGCFAIGVVAQVVGVVAFGVLGAAMAASLYLVLYKGLLLVFARRSVGLCFDRPLRLWGYV